ncbi:hypothetical protein ACJO5Y_17765 [Marinobacter sp. GN3S48]|uniref:hypothetical protein n=1 Tax=unclassified Marinobacter TaxID=83889 RepID=UPI00387B1596
MESPSKRQLTIADLPYRIKDFPLIEKLESRQKVGGFFNVVGIVIAIIGGLIMIGGPSSIRVGLGGPSFGEILLLNPGLVVSMGVLLMFIGSQIVPPVIQEIDTFIADNFTLVDDEGNPSLEGVIHGQIEDEGHLKLVFVPTSDKPLVEQGV